jgi:hypothetical protein
MADILNVQEMLANTFEPRRKFRWILSVDGLEAFMCKTATLPQITFDETVIDYINQKRYVAGKATYSPITITLYNPIVPSAAQQTMEWVRLCWEAVTGRMGYAAFYKKTLHLQELDPVGAIVGDYELQGAWIQDVNFNDLDYSISDPTEITLTIRYDQFVHLF